MNAHSLIGRFVKAMADLLQLAKSSQLYTQLGIIFLAIISAYALVALLRRTSPILRREPQSGPWLQLSRAVFKFRSLLAPLLIILFLGEGIELSELVIEQSWLVRTGQSLAVVFLLHSVIVSYAISPVLVFALRWFLLPVLILQIFGVLATITDYLDAFDLELGNIRISAYGLVRAIVFGSVLFWLGRISNREGQRIIRLQVGIDVGTREVVAKLFQVTLFSALFIVLLQILGINLTALAVFGGALGVGLGIGLQAIASNFISGLIILLDRSMTVGDYIELDDGRLGKIRSINMRSTLLETFDGKDVMVPNEQFITTRFVNWTHNDEKQRYTLKFQVAYKTDIPAMLDIVRHVVRSHPQVINEPDTPTEELADAEISGFGDSGIDILVEFWMEGIDDGKNRVGADLLLMIWQALKDNSIEIPFPQREVKLLNNS